MKIQKECVAMKSRWKMVGRFHGMRYPSAKHSRSLVDGKTPYERRFGIPCDTQWIQSYPCKTKTSQETQRSLQKILEPERNPKVIYTDNSLEFGKSCEDLSWNHCTSTPHRSETDGIADRAVRRVKEGTSSVLLQSGLNESWWADSMESYTYLRNVTDLWSDGKTPDERRFGPPLKGPIIPFGSKVEYHPLTAKDQSRIHQFGKKVLPGKYLGYALYAGWIRKGDVLIADLEELETMDASEIYSKRLNAKEMIFPKEKGKFIFPVADGRIKLFGGDLELRTSTLVRHRPIQGESEGSLPPPQDSFPDAGEAVNDFWSISRDFIHRHHVEPRVELLLAERRIIPHSTETHWRLQNYSYKLGCHARKPHRWWSRDLFFFVRDRIMNAMRPVRFIQNYCARTTPKTGRQPPPRWLTEPSCPERSKPSKRLGHCRTYLSVVALMTTCRKPTTTRTSWSL